MCEKNKRIEDDLEKKIHKELEKYRKLEKIAKIFYRILIVFFLLTTFIYIYEINKESSTQKKIRISKDRIILITQKIKKINKELLNVDIIEKKEILIQMKKSEKELSGVKTELKKIEEFERIERLKKNNKIKNIRDILALLILIGIFFKFVIFENKAIERTEKVVDKLNTNRIINELENDFSNNMMKINIYQLDAYNNQTKVQADKSFKVALGISITGFIILCFGLYFTYIGKTSPGYLATLVGLIIEFISGTIFYLYNKTIIKMSEYHKKLVLTQNISLALKASEDLGSDDKSRVKIKIVDALLQDINKYLSEK